MNKKQKQKQKKSMNKSIFIKKSANVRVVQEVFLYMYA